MSKVLVQKFGFLLSVLCMVFPFSAASGQTVQINPEDLIGPTILRAGWDIKAWPARLDTEGEARGLYVDVDANFIRIPFSPNAHNEDGTVDIAQYATELTAIRSVLAVRPDVEIYASVRLGGANTFPAWVSAPTAAWPAETGSIFDNTVQRPNPEHYSTMVLDYLSYMRDEGISVDFLGLNNETDGAVPFNRYIATHDLLEAKLDAAGFVGEFRDFKYVGPDTFGLNSAVQFVDNLADAGRLDTIDVVASHYYPQFVSGDESDWRDLSTISGRPLFHSELHMPGNSAAIAELSQTVREALAVQFASIRNGVDSYIWWDSGNNTNEVRDVIKREVMTTTLGAAPVFTTPTYQGRGDVDGAPLFQAFVEGSQVTLWIANPGNDMNNLPVNLLSQQVGSCLSGNVFLAPDGDNNLTASDVVPLAFTQSPDGSGFTIDQVPSQSIAVVTFDMEIPGNANEAEVVFSNDFEDGNMTAEIGSMSLVADSATASVVPVTSGSDETLGNNVLLLDQNVTDLDLTLNFTDTLSLANGNTVQIDFDVAARRTNGVGRTIFVDAMDANGNFVTRFVLGDLNAFGNGDNDRQRPGYTTSSAGNLTFGTPPGSFWWGSDATPDSFDVGRDAHMSLTIGASCFDFSTTSQGGTSFSATGLSNFMGASTEIAEVKITSFREVYGVYFDNITVEGVPVDDPTLLGDVNQDGIVNFLDIAPFIGVLSGGGAQAEADTNQDGVVNFLDIAPFIVILTGLS